MREVALVSRGGAGSGRDGATERTRSLKGSRRGNPRVHAKHYFAFLSYSHADRATAEWLHEALESFRVPRRLVGRLTENGAVPRRLTPIFRDRGELAASSDLSEEIEEALAGSRFLVVLCSQPLWRQSGPTLRLLPSSDFTPIARFSRQLWRASPSQATYRARKQRNVSHQRFWKNTTPAAVPRESPLSRSPPISGGMVRRDVWA